MANRWDLFVAFAAGIVLAAFLISSAPAMLGLEPITPQPSVWVQN